MNHNTFKTRPSKHPGHGLGLRIPHYDYILEHKPQIDWFEVISENFMIDGGKPIYYLEKFRENYPIVLHGVSLSIGTTDPLNSVYLKKWKALIDRIEPLWVSDHLCWTGVQNKNSHDLLPLPYTEESLNHIVERILVVQDFLKRPFVLENPSSYVRFGHSTISEWDFLSEIVKLTDCKLLLDVNNVFVSGFNHDFDALTYLRALPRNAIQQIHLAGHQDFGTHILDTHDHPVRDEVWNLYREAIKLFGEIPTMIERDDHIPDFNELTQEWKKAIGIIEEECAL